MHLSCPKLFDPELQVNRKTRKAIIKYLKGILFFAGKKNCSAIAKADGTGHDVVYTFLELGVEVREHLQDFLKRVVSLLPLTKGHWYINIDETIIDKMFSEKIEGVARNWSGTLKDTVDGYSIVVAVITNGKITIPITFKTWLCKKDFPDKHKTRIELAQALMIEIEKIVPGFMFLMDGAFSSENMIIFCRMHKIKYCMRFHSNKRVVIYGEEAPLREHRRIKISSNRYCRVIKGYYKGEKVFIVAFRRTEKKGEMKIVYLITSEEESPRKTINTYKKRWPIEKTFRTTKQHLGLKDCQARSAVKQEAHIFAVFVAYAFLEIQKINSKAKNPEQILHKIRRNKSHRLRDQFETFCGEAGGCIL